MIRYQIGTKIDEDNYADAGGQWACYRCEFVGIVNVKADWIINLVGVEGRESIHTICTPCKTSLENRVKDTIGEIEIKVVDNFILSTRMLS